MEEKTGLLVAEHDVDGMAEAMKALLRDPERAAALGKAGRERATAQFTHAKTAERLRRIMGIELGEAPGSGGEQIDL